MTKTYAHGPAVLWRSTSGGPVLLAPTWDVPRHLQGIAALVWEVLETPLDVARVAVEVRAFVPEDSEVGNVDAVGTALEELVGLGAVERSE